MSCQGTRADAIIIQALANCLYLSIHITESFETFAPVAVAQAVNVTGEYTNIYIGHISETNSLLKQFLLNLLYLPIRLQISQSLCHIHWQLDYGDN